MKKILAIAIALVMAMALSVTAFAADSGSFTMSGDGSWWVQKTFKELTNEDLAGHSTLTCTSDGSIMGAYNSKASGAWETTTDGASSFTIDLTDVPDGEDVAIILRNQTGDFTVEWAFDAEPAPAADDTAAEAPADDAAAETPAETPADAPATGLALAVIPAVVAMAAAVVSKKH